MSSISLENIRYLVTVDDRDQVLTNVNLYEKDGVITYIGPDKKEADRIIDASHLIVYPGLVNTHHHLYQTFTRNLPKVQNMELFDWLKTLYEIWKNIDGETVYYSSLTGLGELMKAGCTTCVDHHYVFPERSAHEIMASEFAAADDIGVRMNATRGSMDLSVKDGGLPPDSVVQSIDEIMKDSEDTVARYHDRRRYAMHQVALAPCSPFSVSRDLLVETAKLARSLGVRMHTHLAETKDEEKYTMDRYGLRPLAYMQSIGWMGDDVWFAHGIHFNEDEIKLLASTGTGIAHCPASNMKLSSGIANIPAMLAAGVKVGLAVDGSASNDGSNMLEEIRLAYLLHRLNSSAKAPGGYDILKMATRGSASLIGRDDIGYLAEGMAADLFAISDQTLSMVCADFDPASYLGCVGYMGNVEYTMINGKIVVEHGELTTIDEEKVTARASVLADQLCGVNS